MNNTNENFNVKQSDQLIEYNNQFLFFKNLIEIDKLPKVLMLTGNKGIGKSTLVNHLMHHYFDNENYNEKDNTFNNKSFFHTQYLNNLFSNIIYLDGSLFQNIKIDDIRNLKANLSKSSLSKKKRFIILNDVEIFNSNSLNALLKIIEEPYQNDHFILINNKSRILLETIKSRCLEIKLNLNDNQRKKIISFLLKKYEQKLLLDQNLLKLSPGNFLRFNHMIGEIEIDFDSSLLENLKIVLNIYKKEKNIFYRDFSFYLCEYFLRKSYSKNLCDIHKFLEDRFFILKNLNKFFLYNLNHNTLINSLERKIK